MSIDMALASEITVASVGLAGPALLAHWAAPALVLLECFS